MGIIMRRNICVAARWPDYLQIVQRKISGFLIFAVHPFAFRMWIGAANVEADDSHRRAASFLADGQADCEFLQHAPSRIMRLRNPATTLIKSVATLHSALVSAEP
jgi:hypothetical protein